MQRCKYIQSLIKTVFSRQKLLALVKLSTTYALFLSFIAVLFLSKWIPHWHQLGVAHKAACILGSISCVASSISGLAYTFMENRRAGIVHGVSVLAIAGANVLFALPLLSEPTAYQGADNPVGGIDLLTAAILLFAGVIAGCFGIATMYCLFSKEKTS